ncbi:MAG: hypothetical protein A2Y10_18260 [Planctomycetes bacterium GWF2_41_51]|nr:MAG: hypothetical protein A2Y10_18260 [Planctomycetes bacterium GWF2_41_51]HBG27947.1 hypothetical protein [Phycisphaerales bacterium]
MFKHKVIFWDVDTQYDFIQEEGRLYMPGAKTIIEKISMARNFALENGFSIIASTDWHNPSDQEISAEPNYIETYPQHCIANTTGSQRIGFLGDLPIKYISVEPIKHIQLKELVNTKQFHIVIRKNKIDVFTNPNTRPLLDIICPEKIIIFGVALDLCVSYTVDDLLKLSKAQIIVLADIVKGLGKKPDDIVLKEFQQKGVTITTLAGLHEVLDVAT